MIPTPFFLHPPFWSSNLLIFTILRFCYSIEILNAFALMPKIRTIKGPNKQKGSKNERSKKRKCRNYDLDENALLDFCQSFYPKVNAVTSSSSKYVEPFRTFLCSIFLPRSRSIKIVFCLLVVFMNFDDDRPGCIFQLSCVQIKCCRQLNVAVYEKNATHEHDLAL